MGPDTALTPFDFSIIKYLNLCGERPSEIHRRMLRDGHDVKYGRVRKTLIKLVSMGVAERIGPQYSFHFYG